MYAVVAPVARSRAATRRSPANPASDFRLSYTMTDATAG